MSGFLTVNQFADIVGVSRATVYNWIALGKIPFQTHNGKEKLIPEFEALETPVVVAKRAKAGLMPVKQPVMPVMETPVTVPKPEEDAIQQDERLFLLARQQAQHFITRAKFCRQDKRHEAEAELLWMAVECFGFKQ